MADRRTGFPSPPAFVAREDLGGAVRGLDQDVRLAVPGEVGRGDHPVGVGDRRGHGHRPVELGQPAGRDHEGLAVAGPPHHEVGVRGRGQVVLELASRPAALRRCGELPDLRDVRVEVAAGAGGLAGVAVAVDGLEVLRADPLLRGRGGDAVQRELPREERAVRLHHRRGRLLDVVVADRRHRERVVVVAQGVRTDDGAVDAAVARLPDPAEAVDHEVVADVAPALGLGVVRVDAADDPGHLVARVVVGVHRVVDEARVHLVVVQRGLVTHPLVGTPLGAAVDHRLGRVARGRQVDLALGGRGVQPGPAGHRLGLDERGRVAGAAVHGVGVERAALGHGAGGLAGVDDRELHVGRHRAGARQRADLDLVDGADDDRLGAGTRAASLAAVRVRGVVVVVGQDAPVAPAVGGLRAQLEAQDVVAHLHAVLPGDTDGAEAGDRLRAAGDLGAAGPRAGLAARVGGDLATAEARDLAAGRRRGRGQGHLVDGGVHRLRREHRRPGLGHGVRREVAGRVAANGGVPGVAGDLTDDVEADHARGRGQGSEHDAERQDLLAGGDVTSLAGGHGLYSSAGEESHVAQLSHESHQHRKRT